MTDKKPDKNLIKIGRRIKAVRMKLELSQRDFAAETGINASYLSEVENKPVKKPPPSLFYSIGTRYNVNLNFLIMGKGEMFLDEAMAEAHEADKTVDREIPLSFPQGIAEMKDLYRLMEVLPYYANLVLTKGDEVYEQQLELIHRKLKRMADEKARQKADDDLKDN